MSCNCESHKTLFAGHLEPHGGSAEGFHPGLLTGQLKCSLLLSRRFADFIGVSGSMSMVGSCNSFIFWLRIDLLNCSSHLDHLPLEPAELIVSLFISDASWHEMLLTRQWCLTFGEKAVFSAFCENSHHFAFTCSRSVVSRCACINRWSGCPTASEASVCLLGSPRVAHTKAKNTVHCDGVQNCITCWQDSLLESEALVASEVRATCPRTVLDKTGAKCDLSESLQIAASTMQIAASTTNLLATIRSARWNSWNRWQWSLVWTALSEPVVFERHNVAERSKASTLAPAGRIPRWSPNLSVPQFLQQYPTIHTSRRCGSVLVCANKFLESWGASTHTFWAPGLLSFASASRVRNALLTDFVHFVCLGPFYPTASGSSTHEVFWFPVADEDEHEGLSQTSDPATSRFSREIPNAASCSVTTFTRTTPAFHKHVKRWRAIGLFPTGTLVRKQASTLTTRRA